MKNRWKIAGVVAAASGLICYSQCSFSTKNSPNTLERHYNIESTLENHQEKNIQSKKEDYIRQKLKNEKIKNKKIESLREQKKINQKKEKNKSNDSLLTERHSVPARESLQNLIEALNENDYKEAERLIPGYNKYFKGFVDADTGEELSAADFIVEDYESYLDKIIEYGCQGYIDKETGEKYFQYGEEAFNKIYFMNLFLLRHEINEKPELFWRLIEKSKEASFLCDYN